MDKQNTKTGFWTKNPVLSMFYYLWVNSVGHRHLFYGYIILGITANAIGLLEPLVVGRMFNSIQFSGNDPELLRHIVFGLFLLLLINVGFWVFYGPSRVMEGRNAFWAERNYRNKMFGRALSLPPQWHKDHHSGDTIDKIEKASQNLFQFGNQTFQVLQNTTNLIGSFIILMLFDWRATLMAVVISVIAISISVLFDRYLRKGYKKIFKAENYLSAGLFDYLSNIITVITLRLRKKAADEIDYRSMRAWPTYKKNLVVNEFKWFSVNMLISVMVLAVISVNAYSTYLATGVIVIGTLYILYGYLERIGNTFYNFAWMYGWIVRMDTAVKAAEVISEEYDKLPHKDKKGLPPDWKTLEIKNLDFEYPEEGREEKKCGRLKDVNIRIRRGRRVAFVGESGSGKSTLFSLLRGLHLPGRAGLFVDGHKMKYGLRHLYDAVTLIPQDPELFNATIKENITMGLKIDHKKVEQAVELARFRSVVERLKKGYRANVMERGVSLSGGEKQRLALARGLLAARDSTFLFLDEPTSSVDSGNELRIYKNIFREFSGKTIIAAVHRLHLLQYFDYIYIFRDGQVTLEGTFDTIMHDHIFKEMWNNYSRIQGK